MISIFNPKAILKAAGDRDREAARLLRIFGHWFRLSRNWNADVRCIGCQVGFENPDWWFVSAMAYDAKEGDECVGSTFCGDCAGMEGITSVVVNQFSRMAGGGHLIQIHNVTGHA